MQGNKQQNIEIAPKKIKKIICKMVNCKALGPDSLHGYWIKMLMSMQRRIVFHRESWKTISELPDWMMTGLIDLLLKGKSKGNKLSNYRPITCLRLMSKLLTAVVVDEIYNHQEENNLLKGRKAVVETVEAQRTSCNR